jgi:Apea-like HEPN
MTPKTAITDAEAVRADAVAMITEAFASLRELHVLPCSVYHPYVRVGRDYEGAAVMRGEAFTKFDETLKRLYPDWFQSTRPDFPRSFPNQFAFSLIQASIARLGRSGEDYQASSETVEALIVQLIDYLDAGTASVSCARMVCHLMTEDRKELLVGDVTVLAQSLWNEVGQIAEVIPTAPSAFNRERPQFFARPEALVVASASGPDPFALISSAQLPINRFLLAIRLLYGVTATGIYQVTGEDSAICRYDAHLDLMDYDSHPFALRPAVLSSADVAPIAALLEVYDRTEHRTEKEVVHPLEMAVLKFSGTFSANGWFENIVDLTTALEASLSGTDRSDIALRVSSRAAALLSTDRDGPSTIFADLKKLYDLRSQLVHGATVLTKDVDNKATSLSVARVNASRRMRVDLMVDRLRDLVRRSILARLVLNDQGTWPLRGEQPLVDQLFADPAIAQEWRESWHEAMTAMGAGSSIHPPTPLADAIMDSYPGKD